MATEDHDFEEINHFNFENHKIIWLTKQTGRVGKFHTLDVKKVYEELKKLLPENHITADILKLFKDSYLKHHNLADATRYLVNKIFQSYGLVILDPDKKELKKLFVPYLKDEITKNTSCKSAQQTNLLLQKQKYKIQVSPRKINLFYAYKDIRQRIEEKKNVFRILNTNIKFTQEQILIEIEKHPERFSPNVILRPLYQEVILPNICYVGGGGEIAYWLQLKNFFHQYHMKLPLLKVRNSVLCISKKIEKQIHKLNIPLERFFLPLHQLISENIRQNNPLFGELIQHENTLGKIFSDIHNTAKNTDKSFIGAVNAEQTRQFKGLHKLIKRLEKAEKRKQLQKAQMIEKLHNQLFPNGKLQERYTNFFELLLEDKKIIKNILNHNDPLQNGIVSITTQ